MYQEKIVKTATFFILILFSTVAFSQKIERYKTEIFSKYDSLTNIQYGEATNLKGESEKLLLDIYSPSADALSPFLKPPPCKKTTKGRFFKTSALGE